MWVGSRYDFLITSSLISLRLQLIKKAQCIYSLAATEGNNQLYCRHSIAGYYMILWYQQSVGDTSLKLIGYVSYTNPTVESSFEGRGDGRNDGTLSIKSLQLNDSAVYFCAVRYTVLQNAQRFYKNLLHLHSCFNYPPTGDVGNNIVYIKWKTFILFTLFSSSPCDIYSTVMLLHLTQTV
uniref:Ig-like domain-containing protein n=1 Tax=Astyanax mexicanus TaxID=7994 RepID=A0A8B9L6U6_ASTMX